MDRLNKGERIKQEEINDYRFELIPKFSLNGQEDVAEYYNHALGEMYEIETYNFNEAYRYQLNMIFVCNNCGHISEKQQDGYVYEIPTNSFSFIKIFDDSFTDKIERTREQCGHTECKMYKKMIKSPEFLVIQLMRFSFDQIKSITIKDNKCIDIPVQFFSDHMHDAHNLFGIIHHLGDSCKHGHYFSKRLRCDNTIETYDDSRCYLNPIENKLPSNNAYLIIFQRSSSYIQNIQDQHQKYLINQELKKWIDYFTCRNIQTFEMHLKYFSSKNIDQNNGEKSLSKSSKNKKMATKKIKCQKQCKSHLTDDQHLKKEFQKEIIKNKFEIPFSIKVSEFFNKYSNLTSLFVYDQMQSIDDKKYFLHIFQLFFKDLLDFSLLNSEILLKFTEDFQNSKIIDDSIETVVKFLLIALYEKKNDIHNHKKTVITFLYLCVFGKMITLEKINLINDNVANSIENPDLRYLISNLNVTYYGIYLEDCKSMVDYDECLDSK